MTEIVFRNAQMVLPDEVVQGSVKVEAGAITGIDPGRLGAELAATGWMLVEHLDDAEIQRRYFATRTDGYRAFPLLHLACAAVV